MPTLKEIDEARKSQINAHRIFWEKVDAIRRPARGFIDVYDVSKKEPAMNKVLLEALDRLREEMNNVVDCGCD